VEFKSTRRIASQILERPVDAVGVTPGQCADAQAFNGCVGVNAHALRVCAAGGEDINIAVAAYAQSQVCQIQGTKGIIHGRHTSRSGPEFHIGIHGSHRNLQRTQTDANKRCVGNTTVARRAVSRHVDRQRRERRELPCSNFGAHRCSRREIRSYS